MLQPLFFGLILLVFLIVYLFIGEAYKNYYFLYLKLESKKFLVEDEKSK